MKVTIETYGYSTSYQVEDMYEEALVDWLDQFEGQCITFSMESE